METRLFQKISGSLQPCSLASSTRTARAFKMERWLPSGAMGTCRSR